MTTTTDTIVAIATANGIGSIAIVRLSGSKAVEIAKQITKKKNFTPRYATLSTLYNAKNEPIDEAIVLYFKAPNSFTAEDVVEFQVHGGFVVAQSVLEAVLACGARVAEAGEFSKRAFFNGRIDLSEAEAIAKLIEAKSEDAAKVLVRQLKGELKDFIEKLRSTLIELLAYSEVTIDYAEEDLPDDLVAQMQQKVVGVVALLENIIATSKARSGLMQGFRVAIVGKPNVGKSSLLNALLRYERAIVSSVAGTTRDTIEEQIKIGTHLIRIVDTAGIRQADDTIEKIGIQRSVEAIKECDIVLALFDGSGEFESEDKEIVELIEQYVDGKTVIFIKNKIDLPQKLTCDIVFDVELNVKSGVELLVAKLQTLLDQNNTSEEPLLVSSRQITAVEKALEATKSANEPLEDGELEIFSFYLNQAIVALNGITKGYENDEMLDAMFGSFCLGK